MGSLHAAETPDLTMQGSECDRRSKKTDALDAELAEIGVSTDFPETLSTAALQGQTFSIDGVRLVSTENGERYVGDITLDGNPEQAWLSGSKLYRQVAALEAHGLPVTVLLTKGDGKFDPYLLQRVV